MVVEPAALAAAGRSLDSCGLLLLGEMHGVRENPLLIRALMQAFGLTSLALEWPDDLAPMVRAFLAGEPLADHPWLWGRDGRITAAHLAVLTERSKAGPLEVILFDGIISASWSWSQRDGAMARRLLAGSPRRSSHPAGSRQRPYPDQPHGPGRSAGRLPGPAAAGHPGDPDQVRGRAFLEFRVMPIRGPCQRSGGGTAARGHRRTHFGPAHSHGGDCASAAAAIATAHAQITIAACERVPGAV
jgi:hypothetical protein